MSERIYLDYNATTPAKPEVVEAMAEILVRGGNASSIHKAGRVARSAVERARGELAEIVNAAPEQIIFTGSGTEANNQALRCTRRPRILCSTIEHESVRFARPDAVPAPVGADGTLDLDSLDRALCQSDEPTVVAVMLANNETGVIQPVAEAARICRRHDAWLHCDAVQALGKIPVDVAALGADSYAFAAHKLAGPQGVGALVVRGPEPVGRLIHGGGQERGLRAGTENVAGIAGFGVAARLAGAALDDYAKLAVMRDELERRVGEIAPDQVVFGAGSPRLPNTAKFTMPGVSSETQVMAMDLAGIAISAGSACAAGKVEPPYVLRAMGVPDDVAVTAVRVSLGWQTRGRDIDRFVSAWRELYLRAGAKAA
jgi:cysteine desulfurase